MARLAQNFIFDGEQPVQLEADDLREPERVLSATNAGED
jgi:hypothetical protein